MLLTRLLPLVCIVRFSAHTKAARVPSKPHPRGVVFEDVTSIDLSEGDDLLSEPNTTTSSSKKSVLSVNCLITTCPLFHVGMSVLRLACFLFSVGIPLKKHLAVFNHRRQMTMNWRRKSTHCKRCFLSWHGQSCWRWDGGSPVWIAALAVPSRWQRLVPLPFSGHWKHQYDRRGCSSVPFKIRR